MHFCTHEPRHHRVQKARTKIKTTVTYGRLSKLSKQMSKAVQMDIFHGLKTFRKKVSAESMMEAFKTGSYGHVLQFIPWEDLPKALSKVLGGLDKTWNQSAEFSKEHLPAPMRKDLRFDTSNPFLKRFIDQRTGALIFDVQKNTQEIVQRAVQRSFTQALSPRRVAEQIRDSIGLDPRREQALANYQNGLYAKGEQTETRIDELVNQYGERLLDQRAMTIARTETRMATNQGQLSVWQQAANQGLIDGKKAGKTWIVDGNPCDICEPMDGVTVPLDGFWTLDDGTVAEVPTDSHPNCFCGMELDFEFSPEEDEE